MFEHLRELLQQNGYEITVVHTDRNIEANRLVARGDLRRDTPSFLERYADSLALIFSLSLFLYSIILAIKARMRQIKKDRINQYFLEFLDIRSKADLTLELQVQKLNDLFQRALLQMTNEKMDKNDFHIFSRLIQQELTNMRLRMPAF